MRLVSVTITNFRGYKDPTRIKIDDLTAIVGKNDVGKSTILEALDIFFNCGTGVVKIDPSDKCVNGETNIVEISCEFDDVPNAINIDATRHTSPADEYLFNPRGNIEIVKTFDCSLKTVKEAVHLRALHPTAGQAKDLLLKKISDLKDIAKTVNASADDERSCGSWRRAIRGAVGELHLEEQLIPVDKEDAKQIWEGLKGYLPVYALFQSDRPSKDDDEEVQNPLKVAVSEALKTVEPQLAQIKAQVESYAMDVAKRTLTKLDEIEPTIASQLRPAFRSEPKYDALFKLSLTGDEDIPVNKRGSGIRRLILLSFFRAEAEKSRRDRNSPGVIYAIEEPESSQHPDNQRMLIKALIQLSNQEHVQVLVTTHVPGLAGLLPEEALRLVSRDHAGVVTISEPDDDVLKTIADKLGVLPDNRVQVLLFVEGPNDVEFLDRIAKILKGTRDEIPTPSDDPRIGIIITGGGNLKHWVNKRYLAGLGKPEVHIYDRDDPASPKYEEAVNSVRAMGHTAFLTNKRELENYLHSDAIRDAFGHTLTAADWDWADIPSLTAEAIHSADPASNPWATLDDDKKKDKCSRAKSRLSVEAADKMDLARLRTVDPANEIEGWFDAIIAKLA